MIAALRSEFLKLTSVRLWWVLLLILVGYVGFTAGLLAGLFATISNQASGAIPDEMLPPIVYSTATAVGYVFPLILGALAVTSEFRYQTLTPTFLAQPRRGVVLGAKAIVLAIAGAVYGIGALVASVGLGALVLSLVGVPTGLGDGDTWLLIARVVLAMALWAAIGVGVGTLIPNQIASIVIVLAFTQFLEPILRFGTAFVEWTAAVGRFLPGAASDALVGASVYTSLGTPTSTDPLEWWQGGLVLAAYGVVIAIAGALTTWRRDVT